MGRGRAKAKQTKVARQLKYSTTGTDLERLQAELTGSSTLPATAGLDTADETADDDEDDDYDDPYAAYADDDEDDD